MRFFFSKSFHKSFQSFDHKTQDVIVQKIEWLQSLEDPLYHAKKLKGCKGLYRFRVGDYRIVFSLSQQQVILIDVDHRRKIYQNL